MVLVCKKRHAEIAEVFDGITESLVVTEEEMSCIIASGMAYERMFGENYILGNIPLLERCWRMYDNRLDVFKLAILQIPQSCKPEKVSSSLFDLGGRICGFARGDL